MASIDKLAERLKETQEFCSVVEKHLEKNFLIEDKTMAAWKKYFKIAIPDELNLMSLVSIAHEIMTKYQQAAHFRDLQQIQMAIMEQTKLEKYHTEYQFARTENERKFKKPLAAESCKTAALLAVKDIEASIATQKVVHSFWVKTCDTLTEMRKLLELVGYALSADTRTQKDFVVRSGQ